MNPQQALSLAHQRQAALRRESPARLARVRAVRLMPAAPGRPWARARRALGWSLVELGLRLALSGENADGPDGLTPDLLRSPQVSRTT